MFGDGEGQGGLQKLADGEGFERTTEDMLEGDKHAAFEELFGEKEGDVIASACASAQTLRLSNLFTEGGVSKSCKSRTGLVRRGSIFHKIVEHRHARSLHF
jgi:hypothetical protein